jgi:hypothetical protein
MVRTNEKGSNNRGILQFSWVAPAQQILKDPAGPDYLIFNKQNGIFSSQFNIFSSQFGVFSSQFVILTSKNADVVNENAILGRQSGNFSRQFVNLDRQNGAIRACLNLNLKVGLRTNSQNGILGVSHFTLDP